MFLECFATFRVFFEIRAGFRKTRILPPSVQGVFQLCRGIRGCGGGISIVRKMGFFDVFFTLKEFPKTPGSVFLAVFLAGMGSKTGYNATARNVGFLAGFWL